jgi:hypothetical protein
MTPRTAALLTLSTLLFVGSFASIAQTAQDPPKDPDGNVIIYKDLPQQKLRLGRDYVGVAANIVRNVNNDSVNGYNAAFFHQENWASGQKDSLFGPFLSLQEAKMNRAAVCLFSSSQNEAACVFFQDEAPYGALTVKTEMGHPFDAKAVAAAYKPITSDMIKEGNYNFKYIKSLIAMDDGTMVKSFYLTEVPNP